MPIALGLSVPHVDRNWTPTGWNCQPVVQPITHYQSEYACLVGTIVDSFSGQRPWHPQACCWRVFPTHRGLLLQRTTPPRRRWAMLLTTRKLTRQSGRKRLEPMEQGNSAPIALSTRPSTMILASALSSPASGSTRQDGATVG